jgi:hypothetical protein
MSSASSTLEFLIPEWGVEFQISEELNGLVYNISNRANQAGIATFSTKDLEDIAPTCSPDVSQGIGSLERWLYDASDTTAGVHIGGYTYAFIEYTGLCAESGALPGNITVTTATKLLSDEASQLEQAVDSTLESITSTTLQIGSINTSTWKTYNGVFEYPPDWSAIDGADLGNFADAGFAPSGSSTSAAYVIAGSRGCRPGPSSVTSSVTISGAVWTRIDDPGEIVICSYPSPSSDGPGGGVDFDFAFDSTTTKAIDEAIISTLNLSGW